MCCLFCFLKKRVFFVVVLFCFVFSKSNWWIGIRRLIITLSSIRNIYAFRCLHYKTNMILSYLLLSLEHHERKKKTHGQPSAELNWYDQPEVCSKAGVWWLHCKRRNCSWKNLQQLDIFALWLHRNRNIQIADTKCTLPHHSLFVN